MLGVRERLPNLCRRMGQVADENERPLLSIFSDLSARSGTRRVLLTAAHVFSFLSEGTFSIFSKCCSRSSTCFDQKRRKGTSHASSSMSGSGSVDTGAAALQFVIPRTQLPLAALAGAWRRTAATVEARARSRQRGALRREQQAQDGPFVGLRDD